MTADGLQILRIIVCQRDETSLMVPDPPRSAEAVEGQEQRIQKFSDFFK
jgi:hypothetical protein